MDYDIVSDLNSPEGTVPAHGSDTQHVNAEPVKAPSTPVAPATPVAETPDTATKPLSLRDQISSALKGEEATPPAAQQDGGPARDAQGRFVQRQEPVADPNTQTPQAAPQTVAAPQGIDPQVFSSLPAETQAQLARTMEDVANGQKRIAHLAPIEQLIAPRIDAWAMNGMAPAQAIHQLLALSDFAFRDPPGFIQYMAQNNGVDLVQLVLGMEQAAANQPPVDPRFKAMEDELARLQGWRAGVEQQQKQAQHQSTVNHVNAFAAEKDAQGNLLRPYFAELGQGILPYVDMVKSQNPNWPHSQVLQEAYDRAVWGNPSTRAKLQQAVDTAADAGRLRQQAERVASARTASASVPSRTPSTPPAAPNDGKASLRDTIRASIAAAS